MARLTQTQKQKQKQVLLPKVQQALFLLQAPVMELSQTLEEKIAENPLLEMELEEVGNEEKPEEQDTDPKELDLEEDSFAVLDEMDESFRSLFRQSGAPREDEEPRERTVEWEPSWRERLLQEIASICSEREQHTLSILLGYLDERGWLSDSPEEIASLEGLSAEEVTSALTLLRKEAPKGVGSKNLQECLLFQLEEGSLPWKIVSEEYENLVHNRLQDIAKRMHISLEQLQRALLTIRALRFHPLAGEEGRQEPIATPDIIIDWEEEEEQWKIRINHSPLPRFNLSHQYVQMAEAKETPKPTRHYLQQKIQQGKWLAKMIDMRETTLFRLTQFLLKRTAAYFRDPEAPLAPIQMKEAAEELEVAESTIARAVSGKTLSCPRGLLLLRSLFTNSYITKAGDSISSSSIKQAIENLIRNEDHKKPMSDQILSEMLRKEGLVVARRTVAKMRGLLGIGNCRERKKY